MGFLSNLRNSINSAKREKAAQMNGKQLKGLLKKFKEERDRKNNTLRWGVKSRDINLPTYFASLRESLMVKHKGRLI